MLEALNKLFTEQVKLSTDMWLIVLTAVVFVAFLVTLLIGLFAGNFKKIRSLMKAVAANPSLAVAKMKQMPGAVKSLYKNARMSNTKPSVLVTEQACVEQPYKHSLISKVWIVTFTATVICSALAFVILQVAPEKKNPADFIFGTAFILILGGLLTFIGAVIGKAAHGGAVKTYEKFALAIDGDNVKAPEQAQPVYAEQPQQVYAESQSVYAEPQQMYAEQPVQTEEQPVYAEQPQQVYAEQPQQAYEEPVAVVQQQESEEELRRRAREEALAQARAEQMRAQQQAQAQAAAQQQTPVGGSSSADDVIAQIEKIDREGAPRETMREVATLLQKERAKPENKTPEQQKRLNEALSKLLKAMSAATRK